MFATVQELCWSGTFILIPPNLINHPAQPCCRFYFTFLRLSFLRRPFGCLEEAFKMSEFAAGIIKWILCPGGLTQRSRRRKAICQEVELYIFMKAAWRKRALGNVSGWCYIAVRRHMLSIHLCADKADKSRRWTFFYPSNCLSVQIVQIWDD